MRKWLALGALGVACLIAGVWLIASGASLGAGQILGIIGVVLILVVVAGFKFAPRFLLVPPKHRRVLFGFAIAGRIVKILVVFAVAAVIFVVFMTA